MAISCRRWHEIKWSMLSRLDRDIGSNSNSCTTHCNPNYLPFLSQTANFADDIDSIDSQSQEVKALQLNEVMSASDTQAVAIASGYGSTNQNAVKKL